MLVVVLLDHRRDYAPWADSVAAAEQRLLLPVLVEEGRVERPRAVLVAEVEDVPDLDRGLELQRAAALGQRSPSIGSRMSAKRGS